MDKFLILFNKFMILSGFTQEWKVDHGNFEKWSLYLFVIVKLE